MCQATSVAHVTYDRQYAHERKRRSELRLRLINAVLTVPKQHEQFWPGVRHLPTQLQSDRASGSSDGYCPARQVRTAAVGTDNDTTAEQIRDVDMTQPRNADLTIEQLEHTRDGSRLYVEL